MRKFTTYLFISCSSWFLLTSCDDDDASAPPKTSFTQDKASVLTGDEVTFVVDQVDADAIALLPYGQEETGKGGVLIPKSSFSSGKASVKFSYSEVGTFSPVVITTNYSEDGESIERTYSDATSITVTSDDNAITAFSFEGSTKTTINQTAGTIVVEMPYANNKGIPYGKNLKAKFTASNFATVRVGGTTQTSETSTNDFNNPVVYTVTANNGSTKDYTVTLDQDAIETDPSFKSFGGKALSKSYMDKQFQGYLSNGENFVALLAPFGQTSQVFDSVRVKYETTGSYSIVHYASATDTLKQESLLNLVASQKQVTVEAQNDATATFNLYYATAPNLELSFVTLNPNVEGKTEDFGVTLKVLKGTDVTALSTTSAVTANAGQTIVGVETVIQDDNDANNDPVPFVSGMVLNFSKPQKFIITWMQDGRPYKVEYLATVVVLE